MNLLLVSKISAFFQCLDWKTIGICVGIGIVLAIILYFVLQRTLLAKFIAFVLVLGSVFGSIGFCYKNNYISPEDLEISKQEYLEAITNPDKYLTIQSNGGFDKSYINDKENDPNCPVADDKYFDINVCEYKDIVVFYYDKIIDGQLNTVNVIFTKLKDKIIFTGCFNVAVDKNEYGGFLGMFQKTEFVFANKMYKGNNIAPLKQIVTKENGGKDSAYNSAKTIEPGYYDKIYEPYPCCLIGEHNDALGINNFFEGPNVYKIFLTANEGCYDILENNFEQLQAIGIKLSNDEADGGLYYQLNTFYTAVYKSVSEINQPETRIDVTSFVGDVQDGVVYKSNRYLNVKYLNVNSNAFDVEKNKENEEIINSFVVNNTVTVEALPKVVFKLNNKNQTDLTGFDITKTPVTITVKGEKENYTLKFDTVEELNNGYEVYLPYEKYNYEIESTVLNFEGKYGSVDITTSTKNVILDYTYEYGTVDVNISLHPIDNVDLSGFDIKAQPVTIRLSNESQTFEFKFDTVEELNGSITQRLPIGTYDWRISSSGLSFSETSGTVEITILDANQEFNYDYKVSTIYVLSTDLEVQEGVVTENITSSDKGWRKCEISIKNWDKLNIKDLTLRTVSYVYREDEYGMLIATGASETASFTTSQKTLQLRLCPSSYLNDGSLKRGYIQFVISINTNDGKTINLSSKSFTWFDDINSEDLAKITFTITEE